MSSNSNLSTAVPATPNSPASGLTGSIVSIATPSPATPGPVGSVSIPITPSTPVTIANPGSSLGTPGSMIQPNSADTDAKVIALEGAVSQIQNALHMILNQLKSFPISGGNLPVATPTASVSLNAGIFNTTSSPITNHQGGTNLFGVTPSAVPQQMQTKHSNSSGQTKEKVPLDYSISMPGIIPFPTQDSKNGKELNAESFLQWKDQVITAIDKIPKFVGILTQKPEESWKFFKWRNEKNYSDESLQAFYIECHKEVWGYLKSCLDGKKGVSLEREFQGKKETLTSLLGFSINYPDAYRNAYALLERLTTRYTKKTFQRTADLLERLSKLYYNGSSDPRDFIEEFHEIFHLGELIENDWPKYTDKVKGLLMMSKLKGTSTRDVLLLLQAKESKQGITIADVEEELTNWWLQRGSQRSSDQPKGEDKKGVKKGNKQQAATAAAANAPQGKPNKSDHKGGPNQKHEKHVDSEDAEGEGQPGHQHSLCAIGIDGETDATAAATTGESPANYSPQRHEIMWDTGATVSITPLAERVVETTKTPPIRISTVNGIVNSRKVGTLNLGGGIRIDNIHVVDTTPYSLFSLSKATSKGYIAVFTKEHGYLIPPASAGGNSTQNDALLTTCMTHAILKAERKGNLWVSQMYTPGKEEQENFTWNRPIVRTGKTIPKKATQPQEEKRSHSSPVIPSKGILKTQSSPNTPAKASPAKTAQSANSFAALSDTKDEESIDEQSDSEADAEH